MGLKSKSRLRLTVLLASVAAAGTLAGGTYGILRVRRTHEIQALKPKGLAAFKSGDLVQALHFLGPYVLRYPDDLEAIEAYAKTRRQLPEPDGAEAQEAMGLYRQIVAIKPESIEDKCTLLDLYAQQNLNTETIQEADEILAQLSARRPAPSANQGSLPAPVSPADAVPIEQALREKAEALRHLRKMDEARKAAEALVAMDPLAPGSAEELFLVMSTAGDAPEAILARMAKIIAGHETEPQIMLLAARTYAAVHDFDHARTAGLAVAGEPLPTENMVLQLADLLDRLEEFSAADKVINAGLSQFHSAKLEDEHFRRLLYREEYAQADAELSKTDATRRPTLAGLHIVALCELADSLQAKGDTAGAKQLRERAQAILPMLADCAQHWDNRAAGWHDVLELAYFSGETSQRELIDKSRDALSVDPGNGFFYFTLGNAYRRAGDDSAAIIQWRSAAALAPAWSGPLASAARFFTSAGDPLQGLDLAQKADRRLPDQKQTLVSIAVAWQHALGAPNIPDAGSLLAFIADPAHQAVFGWDSDILPMEVALKCHINQKTAAEARVHDAIEKIPAENAGALLPLALACQRLNLTSDLPERCFAAYQKLKGNDADLAFARCELILDAARSPADATATTAAAAQAKSLFAAAREGHSKDAPETRESWDFAWSRLLEQLHDPAAGAAWKSLAAANPQNSDAQWSALQALSMHADHAARGDILDRLKALSGDSGLSWRLQKGAWLLEDPGHAGNLDAALELLKTTAAMSPDSAAASELLGQAFSAAGRTPEALTELIKAAELDPRNMQTRLNLGRLYLSQDDKVRAIALRKVAQEMEAPANQRKNAALLLAQAGDMDSAMPVLLAQEAGDPAIKELVAGRLWQTGDWRGAAERYTALLKSPTPEVVEQALHFFASLDSARTADADEKPAIGAARQDGVKQALAALDALKAPAALKHAIRGSYEAQCNQADAAVAELNTAVKLDPANASFHRQLITVLLGANKNTEALAAATDALKITPGDPGCKALQELAASNGKSNTAPLDDSAVREYMISGLLAPAVNQDMPQAAALLQSGVNPKDLAVQLRLLADRNRASAALQVLAVRKLMTAGSFAEGLTLARRAMLDYPADNQPASLAAFCAAQLGKWDEAQADILQWKSTGGGAAAHSLDADLILAMSDLRQGHANDAINLLAPDDASTPAAHPDRKTLVMLLTVARIQAKQFEQASAGLWPEVQQNPSWRDDWARLAIDQIPARDSSGQWHNLDTARVWLEKLSAAAKPNDIEGLSIAGMAWYNFGIKTDDAPAKQNGYQLMRSAAAVTEGDKSLRARAAMILATACETGGDMAGAMAGYRAALALDPTLHPAANNLAMVLARSGQNLPEAESLARRAVAAAPQAATYDDSLAFILRKERKFDDALAAIAKATSLEKTNPEWLLSQAEIQLDAGQTDKARDSLAQLDALAPSSSLPQGLQDRYAKAKARAGGNSLTQGF